MKYIISIDIGLYHLGIIGAIVQNKTIQNIDLCELVDLKSLTEFCDFPNCKLYHSLCIADYMSHFFQSFDFNLNHADLILIEQQPPQGLVSVEQLIVFKYRKKIKMVNPTKMHHHFNIHNLTYERRKEFTVKYSEKHLNEFKSFCQLKRKHDLGDAFCILKYHLHTLPPKIYSKYFNRT